MKQPDDVRRELSTRWDREMAGWAQASAGLVEPTTSWPVSVPLGAPTEGEALRDVAATTSWVRAWLAWTGGGEVRTTQRAWRSLGSQTVPTHLDLTGPADVARVVGRLRDWERLSGRLAQLADVWALTRLNRRATTWVLTAPDSDWRRVLAFLRWVERNPTSGLFPRQLPIPGVDSKWFEQHRTVLTELSRATAGAAARSESADGLPAPASPDFGLRVVHREIAVRALDESLAAAVGGLTTFSASAGQLARLPWAPSAVLICENLQTALSFDHLPGTVVLSRQGYAVDVFGAIPWLRRAARVLYWGDLDTHGFAILNRVRSYLPAAESVLMDTGTLLEHRELWVQEDVPTAATLPLLTPTEQEVYQDLVRDRHAAGVRLEQERVAWAWALAAVEARVPGSRAT